MGYDTLKKYFDTIPMTHIYRELQSSIQPWLDKLEVLVSARENDNILQELEICETTLYSFMEIIRYITQRGGEENPYHSLIPQATTHKEMTSSQSGSYEDLYDHQFSVRLPARHGEEFFRFASYDILHSLTLVPSWVNIIRESIVERRDEGQIYEDAEFIKYCMTLVRANIDATADYEKQLFG